LIKDGIGFTRSELPAALALLAAQNSLVRDEAAMGQPRGGRLPSVASDGPAEPSPEIMLGRTIIEVCRAGNGRSGRSTSPEILERLHDAGEDVTGDQLGGMLTRLADCRVLLRVRQSDAAPIAYVLAGEINGYDETDALEGSIMATLRARDGSYTDEESELKEWLAADGVAFSDRQFGHAIGDLFRWGHLFSPRPEEWRGVGPRPVWLREPPIRKG
jgi:hypothetical protein